MAIPEFKYFILPTLQFAGDGAEHTLAETRAHLASAFNATEADLDEPLPSGAMSRFSNRVYWARTYLVKAGLLDPAGRGRFRITDRGRDVLADNPKVLDKGYLGRFEEFADFSAVKPDGLADEPEQQPDQTPQELLERSYDSLRQALVADLLEQVKQASPAHFEKLVVDLLVKMGYGGSRKNAGRAIGRSGDGGIDGIINEDPLGLDVVLVQAKRWQHSVGRPDVQSFVGSLEGRRAKKGVFLTTAAFTDEARQYVTHIEKRVILIDGCELATLMIDSDVGVTEQAVYRVKKVDADYFDEN